MRRDNELLLRTMSNMHVLVVDDSQVMRSAVSRALKEAGFDFTISQAPDGRAALDVIRNEKIDLVLCDWNMPVMGGIELIRHLRTNGNNVTFGMVTARSTLGSKEEALEAGANFVIFKPFSSDDFKGAISKFVK